MNNQVPELIYQPPSPAFPNRNPPTRIPMTASLFSTNHRTKAILGLAFLLTAFPSLAAAASVVGRITSDNGDYITGGPDFMWSLLELHRASHASAAAR